jgi:hypothetical protein
MSTMNRRVERLRQPDDFRKVFALATETALLLMTVVVVSRRMNGAFVGPVAPAVPCLVATIAVVFSLGALALWTAAAAPMASNRKRVLTAALAVLPPALLGAALWITPSTFVGGYLAALAMASVLCAVAIEDCAGGFVITNQLRSTLFQRQATPTAAPPVSDAVGGQADVEIPTPAIPTPGERPIVPGTAEEESAAMPDEEGESDSSIVQWMTRRRLPDGSEVIEGAVRIDLDPAEKVGVAHLSFLPPLCCDPRAECHLLSDFDGRVRITTAKSYGLRIEARQLGEPTLSSKINVAFSAHTPPTANRAAAA